MDSALCAVDWGATLKANRLSLMRSHSDSTDRYLKRGEEIEMCVVFVFGKQRINGSSGALTAWLDL